VIEKKTTAACLATGYNIEVGHVRKSDRTASVSRAQPRVKGITDARAPQGSMLQHGETNGCIVGCLLS
jgi:hypothetical protein